MKHKRIAGFLGTVCALLVLAQPGNKVLALAAQQVPGLRAGGIEGADWSESPWLVASNVPGGATADNAASPEVIVENASQLQDAVDNALSRGTKRIILRDGVYMLSSSLVLHGLDSFTLEAEHDGMAEILVRSEEHSVIEISNCPSIKIKGCILGHTVLDESPCGPNAYVVEYYNCNSLTIEKCDLFGCGTEGIHRMVAVEDQVTDSIAVKDCIIRDCMGAAVNSWAPSIIITNCIISGNSYAWNEAPAFYLPAGAVIDNCIIVNNHSERLNVGPGYRVIQPAISNCTLRDNGWEKQKPQAYGICLNGLTWQVEGGVLKLGYPLPLDDNTIYVSAPVEPLAYSDSSLPWNKFAYQSVSKAWDQVVSPNTYADPGYELTELVPDMYFDSLADDGNTLLVSAGPFEEFQALYLDGVKLVPGVDYTAESGSTRITILNQTLKSRGAGTHTLTLQFRQASGALKWAVQYYTLAEGTEAAAGEGGVPAVGGLPGTENAGLGVANQTGMNQTTISRNNTNQNSVNQSGNVVSYTVQSGDNLSKIAQNFYGSSRRWRRIYENNSTMIRDPHWIYPGQVLVISSD